MSDTNKAPIDKHHGRDVIKATVKVSKAGDGLSKSMLIDGEFPELEIGDRGLLLIEFEVAKCIIGAALPGDRKGPLAYVLDLEAQAATFTDTAQNQKIINKVKDKLSEASQIKGQRSIKDELGPDDDDDDERASAGGLDPDGEGSE